MTKVAMQGDGCGESGGGGSRRRASAVLASALLAVSAVTLVGCDRLPGFDNKNATATAEAEAVATPEARPTASRDIVRSVTSDGRLDLAMEPLQLGFGSAGRLEEILVDVGEPVFAGRPLAVIETGSLELSVADARSAVVQAENALARSEDSSQLQSARLQVEQAKNQLWGAQAQRDATCGGYEQGQKEGGFAKQAAPSSAQCDGAQANVQALEQGVQLAEESLRALEASLPRDTTAATVQLQRARLALAQAQDSVERATLTSPFTGTVTAVHMLPGLDVSPGMPVVTVDPGGALQFVTTNLGERYVGDIEEGADAEITFTAYPDEKVAATVKRISPRGIVDPSGAVVFAVYLDLEPTDLRLFAGMTGRAEITIARAAE